jgi:DNA-binding winged helix-turn-helix (wHTH) protein
LHKRIFGTDARERRLELESPCFTSRRTDGAATCGPLRKDGTRIRLQGQPLQVLAVLLERPGEMVTRDELRARLWGSDTFVDFEHGLHAAVNKLRHALDDTANQPRYIETIPRRGYRFIGVVEPESVGSNAGASSSTAAAPAAAVAATGEVVVAVPGSRQLVPWPVPSPLLYAAAILFVLAVVAVFLSRSFRGT